MRRSWVQQSRYFVTFCEYVICMKTPRLVVLNLDYMWQSLKTFLVVTAGDGCYWHLVSRGQGYRKHVTMHRMALPTKNHPDQNDSSAEVEKPCSKILFLLSQLLFSGDL